MTLPGKSLIQRLIGISEIWEEKYCGKRLIWLPLAALALTLAGLVYALNHPDNFWYALAPLMIGHCLGYYCMIFGLVKHTYFRIVFDERDKKLSVDAFNFTYKISFFIIIGILFITTFVMDLIPWTKSQLSHLMTWLFVSLMTLRMTLPALYASFHTRPLLAEEDDA